MGGVKHSLSLVIPNQAGDFLLVKRPFDESDPFAGMWGLPAVTLRPGESQTEAGLRIGRQKLGVEVELGRLIGKQYAPRDGYVIYMSDIEAAIGAGFPSVQPAEAGITQYNELKWGKPQELSRAAIAGSLCSRILLDSLEVPYERT